jgi:signal transduction histidine kinase
MSARLLLVEDEENVAATLAAVLADDGYEVECAGTVDAALDRAAATRFAGAVLDVNVGSGDGMAVLRRLKELAPATVVVLLTGYASLPSALDAIRLGADGYLVKPCDLAELKATLASAIERAERRAAEHTRLVEQAQAATRLRDEFLGIAAHELRTPSAALRGYAQMAARAVDGDDADPERVRRSIDEVVRASRRLDALIARLLDVTTLEAGKLRLDRGELDLTRLTSDVVGRLSETLTDHPLVLQDGEPIHVSGDATRLEQVLTNLLDNAAKFSDPGAPIEVKVAADGPDAVLSVRDRGAGIPAEIRGRVFERFRQGFDDRHHGGLGLGLYVTRQIVELHGGSIELEAPADGGTRAVVRLPRVAVAAGARGG